MVKSTRAVVSPVMLALVFGLWTASRSLAQVAPRLDLARGPMATSGRITGLAGAYAGIGDGLEGYRRNPASMANRGYEASGWFHPSIFFAGMRSVSNIDYDNDDARSATDQGIDGFSTGLRLALGHFALGAMYWTRTHTASAGPSELDAQHREVTFMAGLALGEGRILVGAGGGPRTFTLSAPGLPDVDYQTLFADAGILYRPMVRNWRIGARLRLPASAKLAAGSPGGYPSLAANPPGSMLAQPLPSRVLYPWELNVGASYMFRAGERQRNPPIGGWDAWGAKRHLPDRRYVLVAADLTVDGWTSNTVGMESYFDGPAGHRPAGKMGIGLHLGVESEAIHNRMRVRAGTYTESSRATGKVFSRVHFTGGMDVYLIDLWLFAIRVGVAADVAPRYSNLQVGLGLW
ncbi:MAG: hypothetical protein MJD61_17025 [Proteobacteria bacterium]|nr:hypothetical protein [Pseudomonadota bacterium]